MEISLKPDALRTLVLQLLADGEPRAPREIARPNNLNPTATQKTLLDLVRTGRARRFGPVGSYRYQITSSNGAAE
ncbi:hypothetical protein AFEL58S_02077 [Afipia felis]